MSKFPFFFFSEREKVIYFEGLEAVGVEKEPSGSAHFVQLSGHADDVTLSEGVTLNRRHVLDLSTARKNLFQNSFEMFLEIFLT